MPVEMDRRRKDIFSISVSEVFTLGNRFSLRDEI